MKKKIYILFAMPFFYSCSDSSPLEPIPELYLIEIAAEQNNISAYDYKMAMESMAFRCYGLTKAITNKEIKPNIEKEVLTKEFFDRYQKIGLRFLLNRYSVAQNIDLQDYKEDLATNTNELLRIELAPIIKEYLKLIINNYEKSGNYFKNDLIRNDINICGPLYKEMGVYKD